MKLEKAIETLINDYGTQADLKHIAQIMAIFKRFTRKQDIDDSTLGKLLSAGRALKKLGIQ